MPKARRTRRPLAALLAFVLVLPLSYTVMCVDVSGLPELELAHGTGDHHHESLEHHHVQEGSCDADLHQHEAGGSHGCRDEVVSSAFTPGVGARATTPAAPPWVQPAPSWPAVPRLHRSPCSLVAALACGAPTHYVVTSVVALI